MSAAHRSTGRRARLRSARLATLALAILVSACGSGTRAGLAPETLERIPVVLVVFDALDAGHVSHLGHPRDTTPNLDRLATEGISFSQAFAPAPYTIASIASLMTGRLPDRHGSVDKRVRLPDEELTIADLLGAAGYSSFGIASSPNAGEIFGSLQGLDDYTQLHLASDERPPNYSPPGTDIQLRLPNAGEHAPLLAEFLDARADAAEPFFFYAHILEPHSPYNAPEPWRSKYLDPDYDGPFALGDNQTLIDSVHGHIQPSGADKRAVRALYDGNLAFADHGLGLLLDELKQRGLYDECLIIVTSDHGEATFQHGRWGHNDTLFDEMLRVPLVVRFPGAADDGGPRGVVRDELVSIMDILPSLCQWLDLAPPDDLDGRSLAELMATPAEDLPPDERELILRNNSYPTTYGLRSRSLKTILQPNDDPQQQTSLKLRLFDLERDPGEAKNLGYRHPLAVETKRRLQDQVSALVSALRANTRAKISDEEQAMMSALGYVDDVGPVAPAQDQPLEDESGDEPDSE